jgi:two-component system chemotaxis response regulator CheB
LRAIREILSALPNDFPGAVVIVQHIPPHKKSHLAEILGRCTALKVKQAAAGDKLRAGEVFVAPPDHHLLVNPIGRLSLSRAAKVRFSRPAVDVLFESVAMSCGEQGVAVVLTGGDFNGSKGVRAIRAAGGIVVAQDEATCEVFGMPRAAIATGVVDFVLPLDEIANFLVYAANRTVGRAVQNPIVYVRKHQSTTNCGSGQNGCVAKHRPNRTKSAVKSRSTSDGA